MVGKSSAPTPDTNPDLTKRCTCEVPTVLWDDDCPVHGRVAKPDFWSDTPPDTSPGDELFMVLERYKEDIKFLHHQIKGQDLTPDEILAKEDAETTKAKDRLNRLMLTREREQLEKLKPKLITYAHSPVGWAKYKKLDNGDYLMDGKKTDKLAEDIVNYSFDIAIAAIDAQLNKEEK